MIDLVVGKNIIVLRNHADAERFVLEKGFQLTPEDRIRWLYRQLEITNKMNPRTPKIEAHSLEKRVVIFYHQVIEALNNCQVRYLVVGGFAVNFHGYNRTANDLGLWVDISESNLKAIENSMELLGYEFDEFASFKLSDERVVVLSENECVVELMPRLTRMMW